MSSGAAKYGRYTRPTEELLQLVEGHLKEGATQAEIAAVLGVVQSTVHRVIHNNFTWVVVRKKVIPAGGE